MKIVNPFKPGVALATMLGGRDFFWSIVVATGTSQWIVNFVFWRHSLNSPFAVTQFHIGAAVLLVAVTAVIVYVMGFVFGVVWN